MVMIIYLNKKQHLRADLCLAYLTHNLQSFLNYSLYWIFSAPWTAATHVPFLRPVPLGQQRDSSLQLIP